MKRYIELFSILPCTLFLMPHPVTNARLAEVYETLLFKTAAHFMNAAEIAALHQRGTENAENLFDLPETGESEREPLRQGLKQLRLIVGEDLTTIAPNVLALLERKLEVAAQANQNQIRTNQQTEHLDLDPFYLRAGSFYPANSNLNDHGLLLTSPIENNMKLELWNLKTKQHVLVLPETNRYFNQALLGDNRHIALNYTERNSTVIKFGIFDLQTLKMKSDMGMAESSLNSGPTWKGGDFWISNDSRYVMSRNFETKNLIVWDSRENHSVELKDPTVRTVDNIIHNWRSGRFLPDGTVVTIDVTHLHHWDPQTGKLLKTIPLPKFHSHSHIKPAWPDNNSAVPGMALNGSKYWLMALHHDEKVPSFVEWALVDLETGQPLIEPKEQQSLRKLMISPNSKSIAIVSDDSIEIIDIHSKQVLFTVAMPADDIRQLGFSPDGRLLVCARIKNDASIATVWDLANKQTLLEIGDKNQSVIQFAFSSDGKSLIAQGSLNQIRVWSLEVLEAARK